MKRSLTRMFFLLSLLIMVGLTGCANTQEMDRMRTDIQSAADRAATAESAAARAQSAADAASAEAAAARSAAERAEQAARDAQAAVNAVDEKIDRMFRQTMNK